MESLSVAYQDGKCTELEGYHRGMLAGLDKQKEEERPKPIWKSHDGSCSVVGDRFGCW